MVKDSLNVTYNILRGLCDEIIKKIFITEKCVKSDRLVLFGLLRVIDS